MKSRSAEIKERIADEKRELASLKRELTKKKEEVQCKAETIKNLQASLKRVTAYEKEDREKLGFSSHQLCRICRKQQGFEVYKITSRCQLKYEEDPEWETVYEVEEVGPVCEDCFLKHSNGRWFKDRCDAYTHSLGHTAKICFCGIDR